MLLCAARPFPCNAAKHRWCRRSVLRSHAGHPTARVGDAWPGMSAQAWQERCENLGVLRRVRAAATGWMGWATCCSTQDLDGTLSSSWFGWRGVYQFAGGAVVRCRHLRRAQVRGLMVSSRCMLHRALRRLNVEWRQHPLRVGASAQRRANSTRHVARFGKPNTVGERGGGAPAPHAHLSLSTQRGDPGPLDMRRNCLGRSMRRSEVFVAEFVRLRWTDVHTVSIDR